MATKNNVLNLNIEELKGTTVTINNDKNKYLVIYEHDINFIAGIEDLYLYVRDLVNEMAEMGEVDGLSDEDLEKVVSERMDKIREVSLTVKEKFNKVFNDETAYERIFGDISDIFLVVNVIERVANFVAEQRQADADLTQKYVKKYKKK